MQVQEADLLPIAEFKLRWRWTDPKHNALPNEALARIRALSGPKAREFWQEAASYLHGGNLAGDAFAPIIERRVDEDRVVVQNWLAQAIGCAGEQLVVSWDRDTAVLVDCWVFCRYWDDFCYPASDDVLIAPVAGGWALLYHHEEVFVFGTGRNSGTG